MLAGRTLNPTVQTAPRQRPAPPQWKVRKLVRSEAATLRPFIADSEQERPIKTTTKQAPKLSCRQVGGGPRLRQHRRQLQPFEQRSNCPATGRIFRPEPVASKKAALFQNFVRSAPIPGAIPGPKIFTGPTFRSEPRRHSECDPASNFGLHHQRQQLDGRSGESTGRVAIGSQALSRDSSCPSHRRDQSRNPFHRHIAGPEPRCQRLISKVMRPSADLNRLQGNRSESIHRTTVPYPRCIVSCNARTYSAWAQTKAPCPSR